MYACRACSIVIIYLSHLTAATKVVSYVYLFESIFLLFRIHWHKLKNLDIFLTKRNKKEQYSQINNDLSLFLLTFYFFRSC